MRRKVIGASSSLRRPKMVCRGRALFATRKRSSEGYSVRSSTAGPVEESSWLAGITLLAQRNRR